MYQDLEREAEKAARLQKENERLRTGIDGIRSHAEGLAQDLWRSEPEGEPDILQRRAQAVDADIIAMKARSLLAELEHTDE